jgi:hypothetical protein
MSMVLFSRDYAYCFLLKLNIFLMFFAVAQLVIIGQKVRWEWMRA